MTLLVKEPGDRRHIRSSFRIESRSTDVGMSHFGRMLDAAMDEQLDKRAAGPQPFDRALAALEQALSDLRIQCFKPTPAMRAAAELGVELPCSARDIVRAFRRLAFKTHPDRPGGSHEAFLRAQALLHEALGSLQAQAGVPGAASLASRFRAQPAPSSLRSVYA